MSGRPQRKTTEGWVCCSEDFSFPAEGRWVPWEDVKQRRDVIWLRF